MVDNASQDKSAEIVRTQFPEVLFFQNQANLGLSKAVNQALERAVAPYALLLNPDCTAKPGAIGKLLAFMDAHPEAAGCGPKLLFPDGRVQPSCARALTLWAIFCEQFLLEKIGNFGGYWRKGTELDSTFQTEQLMGAALLMRRDKNGHFLRMDESYFLYCEDTDLCDRLWKEVGPLYYVHDAVFVHALGGSGEGDRGAMIAHYNRGKTLFIGQRYGPAAAALCRLLNLCGASLRLLVWSLLAVATLGRFRNQVRIFWRALRLS